mmetsp:Transcript_19298/g.41705  ORF Transcript_19298/g.41705 Transcript_19298/m.41705 type:complete len:80 (+) Transcript_19298:34-273(+)
MLLVGRFCNAHGPRGSAGTYVLGTLKPASYEAVTEGIVTGFRWVLNQWNQDKKVMVIFTEGYAVGVLEVGEVSSDLLIV